MEAEPGISAGLQTPLAGMQGCSTKAKGYFLEEDKATGHDHRVTGFQRSGEEYPRGLPGGKGVVPARAKLWQCRKAQGLKGNKISSVWNEGNRAEAAAWRMV